MGGIWVPKGCVGGYGSFSVSFSSFFLLVLLFLFFPGEQNTTHGRCLGFSYLGFSYLGFSYGFYTCSTSTTTTITTKGRCRV